MLRLMNLIPAGLVDFLLISLIFPSLWRGEYESAVLLLCSLRISMAVDGLNGDGIRSVLAHIYSTIRVGGPGEQDEAGKRTTGGDDEP